LGDVFPGQLLLATDFDGTLAPIVGHPETATALPANLAVIDRLIELGVHIAVISGRAQHDLRLRLPLRGSRILGDNGIGDTTAIERRALDRFNSKVGRLIARQPGVWLERKPGSTSVHYRGAPDAGPSLRSTVLPIANRFGLVTAMGRMVVEVRPQRADKARAVSVLISGLQPKAVIYAGDDEPDHSVFKLLSQMPRPHLNVGVSSVERPVDSFRDCDLVVEGPEGMAAFLRDLLERVARHQPI
jgi:trehalose 6-phosphate phosphatase